MVAVPVETIVDMGAMVAGGVLGDFMVNQCALAGYTWLSPDPTTSGRYTSILVGGALAGGGIATMMYGPANARFPAQAAGCVGAGILSKGVTDLVLRPTVSPAGVRAVSAPTVSAPAVSRAEASIRRPIKAI